MSDLEEKQRRRMERKKRLEEESSMVTSKDEPQTSTETEEGLEERKKKREEERKKREEEENKKREQRRLEREKRRKELMGLSEETETKQEGSNEPDVQPQPEAQPESENTQDDQEKEQKEKEEREQKEKEEREQKEKEEKEQREKEEKEKREQEEKEKREQEEKEQREKEEKEKKEQEEKEQKEKEEKEKKEKEEKEQREQKEKEEKEKREKEQKEKEQKEKERKEREKKSQQTSSAQPVLSAVNPALKKTQTQGRISLSPDEIKEISARITQRSSEEEKKQIEQMTQFNLYQPKINEFLAKYSGLCADSAITLPTPVLLVLGNQGSGKSSFVEAFLGRRLFSNQVSTNRLIRVHLIVNAKATSPLIQIQEERSAKFIKVNPEELGQEINKRNKEENLIRPVNIRIESSQIGFDMIIIDTPPLDEQTLPQIKRVVTPHTHFVCLLKATNLTETPTLKQLIESNFDPLLTSTTFVYTFLDIVLFSHETTRESVNIFFNESFGYTQTNTYWVSLLKAAIFEHQTSNNEEKFNTALSDLYKLVHLQQKELQWDPKFSHKLGFSVIRRALLQESWLKYKEGIPAIQRKLTRRTRESQAEIQKISQALSSLRPLEGRTHAVEYVTRFCQFLEALMEGGLSVASLFPKDGCTLTEEKESCNFFSWPLTSQPIDFNSESFINNIEQAESLLYGSNQVKRLLNEFKAILEQSNIGDIDSMDIESAIGPRASQSKPDNTLAACSIVRQRTQDDFQPLISGLVMRAGHILKLARMMVENYLGTSGQYPPQLISAVKDLFDDFVEKMSKEAERKLNDEFYSTGTFHWFHKSHLNPNSDVKEMATSLYEQTKQNLISRTLLTIVQHFVLSIVEKTEPWQNLVITVASYNSDEIEDFCDFSQRQLQYQKEKTELEKAAESLKNQGQTLQSFEDFPTVN